jgi:hypothetical protein
MKAFRATLALSAILWLVAAPAVTAQTDSTSAPAKTPAAAEKAATAAKAATAKVPATPAKAAAAASAIRTIVGEVVDPACWIVNGAHGEQHKECLLACAKAGQVLAILELKTNKLYLIATENPGEDPNKGVIDFAAQKVTVTGKTYTRGGFTAIKISSITPGGK